MQGFAGRATLLPATSLLLKTATNLARLSLPHYDYSLGEAAQGRVSAHAHIPHTRKCRCLMRDLPYPSVRAVSRRIQMQAKLKRFLIPVSLSLCCNQNVSNSVARTTPTQPSMCSETLLVNQSEFKRTLATALQISCLHGIDHPICSREQR